jgi:type 1 glutamine amidotransferase
MSLRFALPLALSLTCTAAAIAQAPAALTAPGAQAPQARTPLEMQSNGTTGEMKKNLTPSPDRGQSITRDGVRTEKPMLEDYVAMLDNLPRTAPAKPKQPRKILILGASSGYHHSNIPLAASTVEEMGKATGAFTATMTYDITQINDANLAGYDAIFLDNTTGEFLDDKNDAPGTAARRKALLDFVRGGKGLILIHASGDSYHKADVRGGPQHGTWPEFNKMVGGYFKFHWLYPQVITVKIDDPKSPLTSMFHGQEFMVHDETYTFAQDSFSRKNVHVLTSVDYAKMDPEDKKFETEATKRTDGDYALSWIRKEGKGRVFYEVLGHNEHIYAMTPVMQQFLAGIQYALGDLAADDSPSAK